MDNLLQLLGFFDTVSLNETYGTRLLNRVDTKYVVSPAALVKVLTGHLHDYNIVSVNAKVNLAYSTTYFDTKDLSMYQEHHNGRNRRYKVRHRRYEETGDEFIEVKQKFKNRTNKERLKVNKSTCPIDEGLQGIVHLCTPYKADELERKLTTQFNRLTLISKKRCERITIDLDIWFSNGQDKSFYMRNCAVVEIKHDKEDVYSSFARSLKYQGFMPLSISKYCVGTVALNNKVKYNRFKPRLRNIGYLVDSKEQYLSPKVSGHFDRFSADRY